MIHEIHNTRLSVSVNEHGAELYSVRSADGTEYIWQGTAPFWDCRAMNIFPICGRLFEGRYTYHGKEYTMKCHGLARDFDFALSPESNDKQLVLALVGNEETKKIYPFDFSLKFIFALDENKLTCRVSVENTGKDILPFATGGHPGFNVPLSDGLSFSDYSIDFGNIGSMKKLLLSETCFVTGKTAEYPLRDGRYIDLDHHLFDNDAIFFADVPTSVKLSSPKDSHSVTLTCPMVKYLGLWHTNKTEAPFVCIEPWIGLPSTDGVVDDMETKSEMVRLAPKEKFDFTYELLFE